MSEKVVVLTGGVGGAKLVDGLYRAMPADDLTAIVNTGDDFVHLGLPVSPDIDTLLYTLSGRVNRELGWGRQGESWSFMEAIASLGGEDWFRLGDGDLALHVLRRVALEAGEPLSAIIARFARAWDLGLAILPMSDDRVATWLDTDKGILPFQRYFVEQRWLPRVAGVVFEGAERASAAPGVIEAIERADAILVAPSNPWLSVDPLLAIPDLRAALDNRRSPLVAVSPLVRGDAVKGPTAKLMRELDIDVSNAGIAAHYAGLLDGLLVHEADAAPTGLEIGRTDTIMKSPADKVRVAEAALALARECRG